MSMTAASVPLTLKDGTQFRFSPLTDKDVDELEAWVRHRIVHLARESLTAEASAAEREETLTIALTEATKVSIYSPEYAQLLATVPGMLRILWQSLKREHPELTEEKLRHYISDPENIMLINEAFAAVNIPKEPKIKKVYRARKKKRK